ncbi:MAG: YihY/virulence factor BrkB family protein, partial [Actinomycetes bacterium]
PFVGVVMLGWLAVVYRYAPNRRTGWRTGLPGAVLTTVSWLVATAGFHVYLRLSGSTNPVLGAYGGAAILMIWVYLLTIALLLGGELNAVLARRAVEPASRDSAAADAR